MGYDFYAADRSKLITPPKAGIDWDVHPNWFDQHHDYWADYRVGGWLHTGYYLGEALDVVLTACEVADHRKAPDTPGEVIEWFESEQDDDEMSDIVRAFLSQPAPMGKMLMYKFMEPDGFLVTAAECTVISRAIGDWYSAGAQGLPPDEREGVLTFGGYARFCTDHGGFYVR